MAEPPRTEWSKFQFHTMYDMAFAGNAGRMRTAASGWRQMGQMLQTLSSNLQRYRDQVAPAWDSQAGDVFRGKMTDLITNLHDYSLAAYKYGDILWDCSWAVEQAQRDMNTLNQSRESYIAEKEDLNNLGDPSNSWWGADFVNDVADVGNDVFNNITGDNHIDPAVMRRYDADARRIMTTLAEAYLTADSVRPTLPAYKGPVIQIPVMPSISVPSAPGAPGLPGTPGTPLVPTMPTAPNTPVTPPTVPVVPVVPVLPTGPTLAGGPPAPTVPPAPSPGAGPVPTLPGTPGMPILPGIPGMPIMPGTGGGPLPGTGGKLPSTPAMPGMSKPGQAGKTGMPPSPGSGRPGVIGKRPGQPGMPGQPGRPGRTGTPPAAGSRGQPGRGGMPPGAGSRRGVIGGRQGTPGQPGRTGLPPSAGQPGRGGQIGRPGQQGRAGQPDPHGRTGVPPSAGSRRGIIGQRPGADDLGRGRQQSGMPPAARQRGRGAAEPRRPIDGRGIPEGAGRGAARGTPPPTIGNTSRPARPVDLDHRVLGGDRPTAPPGTRGATRAARGAAPVPDDMAARRPGIAARNAAAPPVVRGSEAPPQQANEERLRARRPAHDPQDGELGIVEQVAPPPVIETPERPRHGEVERGPAIGGSTG